MGIPIMKTFIMKYPYLEMRSLCLYGAQMSKNKLYCGDNESMF